MNILKNADFTTTTTKKTIRQKDKSQKKTIE